MVNTEIKDEVIVTVKTPAFFSSFESETEVDLLPFVFDEFSDDNAVESAVEEFDVEVLDDDLDALEPSHQIAVNG